jgi:uncharacterized protein (DUF952 family)
MTNAGEMIYHVTNKNTWNAAVKNGFYETPSLKSEGFIHCSGQGQVAGVLDRYYQGQTDLVKLCIDPSKLTNPLIYELAPSVNEEFPHVYGFINLDAVIKVEPLL